MGDLHVQMGTQFFTRRAPSARRARTLTHTRRRCRSPVEPARAAKYDSVANANCCGAILQHSPLYTTGTCERFLRRTYGTMKVPCQMPNFESLLAAVSFCPLPPYAVMTRSGSDARNFLAVSMAPVLSSLILMSSM